MLKETDVAAVVFKGSDVVAIVKGIDASAIIERTCIMK